MLGELDISIVVVYFPCLENLIPKTARREARGMAEAVRKGGVRDGRWRW